MRKHMGAIRQPATDNMTTAEALAFITWPPCPLHLPEQAAYRPGENITDIPGFLAAQIQQVDCGVPLLQRLARERLDDFLASLHRPASAPPSPSERGRG